MLIAMQIPWTAQEDEMWQAEEAAGLTFEYDESKVPAFSSSFSLNSLPTSLSGSTSSSIPSAASLACTGML